MIVLKLVIVFLQEELLGNLLIIDLESEIILFDI